MASVKKPKILILDIESSFKLAGVWGRFKQDISMNQIIQDTHILCWSAKWLGEKKFMSDSLHKHITLYKKDPTNDRKVLESVWKLLDEADYVVAHNGARFDGPVLNARFIQHGMQPPSSYKMIDTLSLARRSFKFTSNRLDDLGKALKVGQKAETGGFDLWKQIVLKQDKRAFAKMVKYCEQDVRLLEKVYLALRAWDKNHPSTVVSNDVDAPTCNVCESIRVKKNGSYATNTQVYQKYKCQDCGHSMRSRKSVSKTSPQLLKSI
jgi:DNA polymerase elongation subunit (family B)